ncbi:hypothetical protein B0H11DRAFT_2182357 [Mycena galericulata]|nr:hypothetical protein B0H11DRAFT_2182357 [Mycena galericulata]
MAFSSNHPYSLDLTASSCDIVFLEFRGTGPPPSNVGSAGDVYLDLTPGLYGLYWRDRNADGSVEWKRWTALLLDKVPLYKYLTPHPWAASAQASDLYLWADPNGITWTSQNNICSSRVFMVQKNIGTVVPGRPFVIEALVSDVLHKMIETEHRRSSQHPHSRGGEPTSYAASPPPGLHSPTRPDSNNSSTFHPFPRTSRESPSSPSSNVSTQDRLSLATEEMNKALRAEEQMKQQLRAKTRELAKFKGQEKELMGMSYRHEKRERELNAAIASAEIRSAEELSRTREALLTTQREAEAIRREHQISVARLKVAEEELAGAQRRIESLHSYLKLLHSENARLRENPDIEKARGAGLNE